jgi:tripartite-type tricarboxylate transporter receptor subunit TctC
MRHLLSVLLLIAALPVAAQTYPSKTVRMVVAFPAGGSTDAMARVVSENLNKSSGQQLFIVDNRPGATGTIGSAIVANAPPDGYTLIMHSMSTYIAGFMYRKVAYDPAKAFAPIINCTTNPFILVSAASLPVKSIGDLIALARRRPGEVTFGTVGMGSGSHLAAEMFSTAAGIKTVAIAYKGSAPALIGLASGEVAFSVNNILDTRPFITQGKMRALAVTSARRSPAVPNVPTLMESGIPIDASLWTGLFAPAATPKAVVNKLNEDITRMLDTPQMKEWLLNALGGEFAPHTPEQFSAFVDTDAARWQKVVQQLRVQLD